METYFEGEHVAKVGGCGVEGVDGKQHVDQRCLACASLPHLGAARMLVSCFLAHAWPCSHPTHHHATNHPSASCAHTLTCMQADLAEGCADCLAWLEECGAVVTVTAGTTSAATATSAATSAASLSTSPTEAALDCKESAGQLKMPEEKKKVAHGDANLQIEDFLKTFTPGEQQDGGNGGW